MRSTDIGEKGSPRRLDVAYTCFRYDTPSRNPMTGDSGQDWNCTATIFYKRKVTEAATGDLFWLSRKSAPPFVLDSGATALDALKRKTGPI